MAMKDRSPRQDLMLLYLCVALSQSAQPRLLQKLGPKTTPAIVAAARIRVQDKDLQVGGSVYAYARARAATGYKHAAGS